ncbi:cysteine hydrolase family protein [Corynebacterium sp.]|uniref:cysteine hydrolase family protein n=1 Tax=Corynebacterium sp. TaxID=1720 RepID=UPI0026DD1C56|nr:isochorismatase family cysteine hydrolase [Corynebacterium sp.]MDO5032428.1 isochorismatase family cysteine hydrolase [Corynebacterium sp.]
MHPEFSADASALIVVDLQKGILAMTPVEVAAPIIAANRRLAAAWQSAGRPVVWVTANGLPAGHVAQPVPEPAELPADFATLHPDFSVKDGDILLPKPRTISPFARTDLAAQLRERGITDVVIGGIATGAGVEGCARSAYDEGFTVTVVADACADPNPARHAASLQNVLPTIGFTTSTEDAVAALAAHSCP